MFVAFIFMFIGAFLVIAFLACAISYACHWGDPALRPEKQSQLLRAIPAFLWGVGSFCFTFQMLMWYYGAISPTGSKTYPLNHLGTIHYVNGPLHHWMIGITLVCFAGFLASVLIWTAKAKAEKAAASKTDIKPQS